MVEFINKWTVTRGVEAKYEALVEVVEDRAGDALRAAATYRDGDIELLYQRDDLDTRLLQQRTEHVVEGIERREPFVEHDEVGDCLADLELYEDYVFVHWYAEEVIVSLEPVVARRLKDFVEECSLALTNPDASRFRVE